MTEQASSGEQHAGQRALTSRFDAILNLWALMTGLGNDYEERVRNDTQAQRKDYYILFNGFYTHTSASTASLSVSFSRVSMLLMWYGVLEVRLPATRHDRLARGAQADMVPELDTGA